LVKLEELLDLDWGGLWWKLYC